MKAIKICVKDENISKIDFVIGKLNSFEDTAALMCDKHELFVAAVGKCAIRYAICVLKAEFGEELSIQYIK